jgi:hypothetical protein
MIMSAAMPAMKLNSHKSAGVNTLWHFHVQSSILYRTTEGGHRSTIETVEHHLEKFNLRTGRECGMMFHCAHLEDIECGHY